jgi:predicted NBD/HSP70 family sugar kinase
MTCVKSPAFPTTTPEETLAGGVTRFLSSAKSKHGPFAAIGIGSFGPIDLDQNSETYGYITSTPKPGWQFTNIVPKLQEPLSCSHRLGHRCECRRARRIPLGRGTEH